MLRFLLLLIVGLSPTFALAFSVSTTDISQPYEITPIELALPAQSSFLGTLADFPVMYEITSDKPFTLTTQLAQPINQEVQPLSLLIIRRNDRGGGVTEVARQPYISTDWFQNRNSLLGMSLLLSPQLETPVEAGTYRIEVSSPNNTGKYMFTIGTEPEDVGYFAQLGFIRQTQSYFGYGFFSLLKSSVVYYPIGILLLLGAFFQTYRLTKRNKLSNA